MKKESIVVGIIGLFAGLLIAGATAVVAVNNDNHSMMEMMGMETNHSHQQEASNHGEMSMSEMTEQLKTKSGDDYDKAFIEMMIAHHEGAVAMAKLSPERAKHEEVKQLSEDIVEAQENEIADMKQWQIDWGYTTNESSEMMHGSH